MLIVAHYLYLDTLWYKSLGNWENEELQIMDLCVCFVYRIYFSTFSLTEADDSFIAIL